MNFSTHNSSWSNLVAVVFVFCNLLGARAEVPETVDFNFHIRPILSDRCYFCHGPDAENREADLRLDVEEGALAALQDSDGSHAIKPGDPEQSEVFLRVSASDEDLRMPPLDSNLALTADEIDLIRRWIEQGAEWKPHWSFTPVKETPVPVSLDTAWPRNEIDQFILARLEGESLQPAAAASREKRIRRATYDLTGLPPTVEEIDAFLEDETPEAYEKVVDRLLASPRYGERMAVEWLDVARYSDTYGYQSDVYRPVWPWRDWVVEAFNENMPYDEFIIWQLAGDLLPGGDKTSTLATAFNRLHRQTNEGGSIEEEFRVEYAADRTETFGTAFLGLTFQCIKCHDHKYDPLTQKDYYQISSFFDNIDESGLYSHFTDAIPTPTLLLPQREQEIQLATLAQKIVDAEAHLDQIANEQQAPMDTWLAKQPRQASIAGLIGDYAMESLEGREIVNRVDPEQPGQVAENPEIVAGKIGNGLHLSGENKFMTPVGGLFSRHDPFTIGLWINTPDEKDRAVIWHRSRAWTDAGSRGYQLLLEEGKLSASLIHFWPGNAIRILTDRKMPTNRWIHVVVTYDGSSHAEGLAIYVDGQLEKCTTLRDNLSKTLAYEEKNSGAKETKSITLGQRFRDRGFKNGLVDELKIYDRELTVLEVEQVYEGRALSELLALPRAKRSEQQNTKLSAYYLHNHSDEFAQALKALQAARKQHGDLVDSIAEIMVMRELSTPRPTYVLQRGVYDAPGEQVESNTPASLPPMAEHLPRNRLGLARWLTNSAHPLTSRVAVNRYWQMVFGRGLVATPNDFGSQGELPSHPDLLEWLSKSLVDSDWDVKLLLKRMVMSAAYQQSSKCSPELRARDPANILLARGPHHRLSAEMLRDSALAAGGLLVEKRGGPPVKPYQPEGLWKEKGVLIYHRDVGEGSHRRSLYTFWKRTSPPPSMLTLDAAKRDVCAVQRQATQTPLQSLVLLNDPQYVEAARALAERAMEHQKKSLGGQLIYLFKILTSRAPYENEIRLLESTYLQQLAAFQSQPERAQQFLAVGDQVPSKTLDHAELAAMTVVAETVMNFEESVSR